MHFRSYSNSSNSWETIEKYAYRPIFNHSLHQQCIHTLSLFLSPCINRKAPSVTTDHRQRWLSSSKKKITFSFFFIINWVLGCACAFERQLLPPVRKWDNDFFFLVFKMMYKYDRRSLVPLDSLLFSVLFITMSKS
jgi:hypothetical protein